MARVTASPGEGFAPFEQATFWHEMPVTRELVLDRMASVSHIAVLADDERRQVLAEVDGSIPDDAPLAIRYRVDAYAATRT